MPGDDPTFLKYFAEQTDKKFDSVFTYLDQINQSLSDLKLFRERVLNDAKWKGLIVSALVSGGFSLISLAFSIYFSLKKGN